MTYDESWECEDCLGTGGRRNEYGEGDCGACGGTGTVHLNTPAEQARAEAERKDWFLELARREMDDDY
jgi:DnaJ-class molecular chaperone